MSLTHYHARLLVTALRDEGYKAFDVGVGRANRRKVCHTAPQFVVDSMIQTFGLGVES